MPDIGLLERVNKFVSASRVSDFDMVGVFDMVLRIEESDLNNVLLAHKDAIGSLSVGHGIADTVAGIFYIATAVSAGFHVVVRVGLAIIGLLFSIYGVRQYRQASRSRYTDRQLFEDIKRMDRTEVRSSLIAVRGCGDYYGDRFLLYHDSGWDCDFLPNRKTTDPALEEISQLANYLSEQYGISRDDFDMAFVTDAESRKPCVEHDDQLRYYHYRLYRASLKRLPDAWHAPSFRTGGGKECRWMSVDEMFADRRIRQVNGDVIKAVRDYL